MKFSISCLITLEFSFKTFVLHSNVSPFPFYKVLNTSWECEYSEYMNDAEHNKHNAYVLICTDSDMQCTERVCVCFGRNSIRVRIMLLYNLPFHIVCLAVDCCVVCCALYHYLYHALGCFGLVSTLGCGCGYETGRRSYGITSDLCAK